MRTHINICLGNFLEDGSRVHGTYQVTGLVIATDNANQIGITGAIAKMHTSVKTERVNSRR